MKEPGHTSPGLFRAGRGAGPQSGSGRRRDVLQGSRPPRGAPAILAIGCGTRRSRRRDMGGIPTRRVAGAIVALLLGSGCGGGTVTCASVADDAIVVLQDTISLVDGFSDEELDAFITAGSGTPGPLADLERRGDELSAQAASIGCSDVDMASLLVERSGDLDTTNAFGRFVVETLRTGAFFSDS